MPSDVKCSNLGCNETFANRMQLKRHRDNKCKFPAPPKQKIFRVTEDNKFACLKCEQVFKYKPGVFKHVNKNRCSKKKVSNFECDVCGKTFDRPDRLEAHKANHNKEPLICQQCYREYSRPDHFKKHVATCQDVPPSFTLTNPTEESLDVTFDDVSNLQPNAEIPEMAGVEDNEQIVPEDHEQIVPDDDDEIGDYVEAAGGFGDSVETDFYDSGSPKFRARMRQRKKRSLDTMVQFLSERVHSSTLLETAIEVKNDQNSEQKYEQLTCDSFIQHLISLQGNDKEFFQMLNHALGDYLNDSEFFKWLSGKLGYKYPSYFRRKLDRWEKNDFAEMRGRASLSDEDRQYVYNLWTENSIPSVDFRNGRDTVKIRHDKYDMRYQNLSNDRYPVEEKLKRGVKVYVAPRRVATCTVRKMKSKIFNDRGLNISIGLLSYLRPFYITDPTDKEKVMCMCKFCLNFRLKFIALMTHSKRFDGPFFDSISKYYMGSCKCSKGDNGYWALKCVEGECTQCKSKSIPDIPNLDPKITLSFHQFQVQNVPYTCKKTGEQKVSTQTVRETLQQDVKSVHDELLASSKAYLRHRFQIENDRHHWKIILHRNEETIFHMDFSENISGSPKYEPQDAHFSKKQFSLHCTVAHHPDHNTYLYHLSDNRKHNHNFTSAVVNSLLERYPDNTIFKFKSDNCSEQYKCLNVFPIFHQLAIKHQKTFIYYYGVKGHGKGLVDAMSGFGLKTPLRKAIVTHDVFYDSAEKVCDFITTLMQDDESKIYECLNDISSDDPKEQMAIKGSRKCHMLSYFPSGEIQIKEEICSCPKCSIGNFVSCDDPTTGAKGRIHLAGVNDSDDSDFDDNVDEYESDDEEVDDIPSEMEEYELFKHTEFGDTINIGQIIAIYASENVNEPFYLCKVLEKKHTSENTHDSSQHFIPADTDYMVCYYLEKTDESLKKGLVQYKLLEDKEIFITYNHVLFSEVQIMPNLKMDMETYQLLSEIGLTMTGRH